MKSLTKKAILLASVVAAAGTFAVCAATVTVNEPTVDAKNVTVSFTADVADTDQITILAYNTETLDGDTPTTGNIVYIDQMAKSAATGNQITFSLRDGDADGKYKVLMGGTGVAVAGNREFTVGGGTTTNGTITGVVTSDNTSVMPSITVSDGAAVDQTVQAGSDGSYSIDVPAGTYTVQLKLVGYLTRTFNNVVITAGQSVPLDTTKLRGGDILPDGAIDDGDLGVINTAWYTAEGDDAFDAMADLTGDLAIEDGDLGVLNANWYLDESVYDN